MTLEERATALIGRLYREMGRNNKPEDVFKSVVLALKEQDKITRHACAEELLAKASYGLGDVGTLTTSVAHEAVMNCRRGVE